MEVVDELFHTIDRKMAKAVKTVHKACKKDGEKELSK